jgi:hypothetical protein
MRCMGLREENPSTGCITTDTRVRMDISGPTVHGAFGVVKRGSSVYDAMPVPHVDVGKSIAVAMARLNQPFGGRRQCRE